MRTAAEVIEGWDCGVATMKRTEVARFLVNPSYAFGEFGCPPRIPAGATSKPNTHTHIHTNTDACTFLPVMFEIELMSFLDYKAADEFGSLTASEKREASLDQLIAAAHAEKEVCQLVLLSWLHSPSP